MHVLLDESVPRQLAPLLTGHAVSTVQREGWSGVSNGELLARAAGRFDALVTGDQGLEFQQDLSRLELGVVVLVAPNNRVETITALAPRVLDALESLPPGSVVRVAA